MIKLGPTGVLEGPWKVPGDPWVVLGCSLEGPWRLLGGSLGAPWMGPFGDQTGTQGWTGTGPAPGTQKVPKVYNCRQKQAQGQTTRQHRGGGFWDPLGDSLKEPTRTLSCTNC